MIALGCRQTWRAGALVGAASFLAACGGVQTSAPDTREPAGEIGAPTGAWSLDAANSRVSFVSVKAGEIAEVHRFGALEGRVAADGGAEVTILLDSVETFVDVRNERMREMLFETGLHPEARITTTIDLAAFRDMAPGARSETNATLKLSLHGVQAEVEADLFVTRLGPSRVSVETAAPIIVDAATFGLSDGVERLREAAGLPSIAPLAPVVASLVFEAEPSR